MLKGVVYECNQGVINVILYYRGSFPYQNEVAANTVLLGEGVDTSIIR